MANEDPDYLAWIRTQACAAQGPTCRLTIEAHHTGPSGVALKSHDHMAVPLCTQHHRDMHAMSGPFKTMGKTDRRLWELHQVAWYRARYQQEGE